MEYIKICINVGATIVDSSTKNKEIFSIPMHEFPLKSEAIEALLIQKLIAFRKLNGSD